MIAVTVLGGVAACDGMFTAEIVQEEIAQEDETVAVAGVSVYPKLLEVDRLESSNQLEAEIAPANASNQLLFWESSDDAVAIVDSAGVVTLEDVISGRSKSDTLRVQPIRAF